MPIEISFDRYRPKACAFFAGRVWYGGIPSGEKLGWIMFSQVLSDISNAEKCYQENDPTSEVFSDILDTDGGVIQIPEAGEIVGLAPSTKSLFVFASNGVWQIIGGDSGFTAASYSVEKVTSVGCLFQKTIVPVEESIFYWSNSGIYLLTVDTVGLTATVKNISDNTIKTLYQSIPTINKMYADGKYNGTDKIVQWLYNDEQLENTSQRKYLKNKAILFDLRLGCFYTKTFDNTTGPLIVSLGITKETVQDTLEFDVVSEEDEVLSNTDEVIADISSINSNIKQFKYYTLVPVSTLYSTTFSDLSQAQFADWYKYNNTGTEVDSYVLTGYNMGGVGPARSKTAQYVHVFCKRTETAFDSNTQPVNPSGVLMQTRWDFTDNSYPNKWSDEVQVYRQLRPYWGEPNTTFEDGYPLVITKNKIRGRGKALQIKLQAEDGKDMSVVGWSLGFVGNTNV